MKNAKVEENNMNRITYLSLDQTNKREKYWKGVNETEKRMFNLQVRRFLLTINKRPSIFSKTKTIKFDFSMKISVIY